MKRMTRLLLSSAAIALLAGCATPTGEDAENRADQAVTLNFFEKSIGGIEAPMLQTAELAQSTTPGVPPVGAPTAPRAFFFAGNATSPNENAKAVIPAASRVIPDQATRRYLHDLAAKLLAQVPGSPPPVQIHLLASPVYEAFAMADGDVYISIKAMAEAETEDELALLLGHELGHILLAHHDKDALFEQYQGVTTKAAVGVLSASYFAASAKYGGFGSGGMPTTGQQAVQQDMMAVQGAKYAVDFVAEDFLGASWNRAQEGDADLIGLDLAVAAGYDPEEIEGGLAHLIEAAQNRQTRLENLSAVADKRSADLEKSMQASFASGDLSLGPVLATGMGVMVEAAGAAFLDLKDYFGRSYASPKRRLERAYAYTDKVYADFEPTAEDNYEATKQRLRIVPLNNAYSKVDEAIVLIAAKDFATARTKLSEAQASGLISGHPVPRMAEAIALQGLNDPRGALNALKSVSYDAQLPVEGYMQMASLEASVGSPGAATATLDRAEATYGKVAVIPTRIVVLSQIGREAEARATLQQCASLGSDVNRQCRNAAAGAGLIAPAKTSSGIFDGLFGGGSTGTAEDTTTASAPATSSSNGFLGSILSPTATQPATATPAATATGAPAPAPTGTESTDTGSPFNGITNAVKGLGGSLF